MEIEAILEELAAAARRGAEANQRNEKMIAELREVVVMMTKILAARGHLGEGHVRMLDKLAEKARFATEPHIELNIYTDKYVVENSEVDCGARMHLCHGRCCSFNVKLSEQDLVEGEVAWRIKEPYLLAQNKEGYCVYQTRETGFCGNYQYRPAPCRVYSCKDDSRIWLDFEKMIPAPMPDGLVTIRRKVG